MKLTKRQLFALVENLLFEEATNQPAYKRNINREIDNLISLIDSETAGFSNVNVRKGFGNTIKKLKTDVAQPVDRGNKDEVLKLFNPAYDQFKSYRKDGSVKEPAFKKIDQQFRVLAF